MTKAASRLNIAVQTVSSQVHELEKDLGHLLFKPAGRGLALTDAGFAAMKLADQIFQIGERLPSIVSGSAAIPRNRLALGVADGLPKLVSKELLDSIILVGKNTIDDTRTIYNTLEHCEWYPKQAVKAALAYLDDCEAVL